MWGREGEEVKKGGREGGRERWKSWERVMDGWVEERMPRRMEERRDGELARKMGERKEKCRKTEQDYSCKR